MATNDYRKMHREKARTGVDRAELAPKARMLAEQRESSSGPMPIPEASRYRIRYCIETKSNLRIGNGSTALFEQEAADVEVATLARDGSGRVFIPGSTLKGNLLAWARRNDLSAEDRTTLFGQMEGMGSIDFIGGSLKSVPTPAPGTTVPGWNEERSSYLEVRNAHSRKTGAVRDEKLFTTECVPPGARFTVEFIVRGNSELLKSALAFLDEALADGAGFGASRGLGFGKVGWVEREIAAIDAAQLFSSRTDQKGIRSYSLNWNTLETRKAPSISPREHAGVLELLLEFETPFLVRAPIPEKDAAGHQIAGFSRDFSGKPLVKASSLKGPFRTQAERILRTMGISACDPSDAKNACQGDAQDCCPACMLFGGVGRASRIRFSDAPVSGSEGRQDFVAIDRFTGGAADSKKFAAKPLVPAADEKPRLSLRLELPTELRGWQKALLGLVLRDLHEGDFRFGWGKSKGYGRARILNWDEIRRSLAVTEDDFRGLEGLKETLPETATIVNPEHRGKNRAVL